MHHFATALCAGLMASVVVVSGAALTPAGRREDAQRRGGCPKRDDRCVQGSGQREEDQVAREPQIRERLRRQGCQTHANHEHQRRAQRSECKDFAGAPTPGMGM
jgi:hypothetical protein